MRRNPARPGLSIVDANQDRLITYQDDVLAIKSEIEKTWPELVVVFDTVDEEWVIYEHCQDGVDRWTLSTKALSTRTLEKLRKADKYRGEHVDLNAALEKAQDELDRQKDAEFSEMIGEANERFLHGLRKDGFATGPIFMGEEIGNRKGRVKRVADYT